MTYKDLLIEVQNLREHYVDSCSMCTKLECDECPMQCIIEDLDKIIKEAEE